MTLDAIKKYLRAVNYLSAAQLYLWDNHLLDKKLKFDHIKPRLLGHWGTCPGINFVYAHLNWYILKHHSKMLYVVGPGHGLPALQANLFLEGTLEKYYPELTQTKEGVAKLLSDFSWPYKFPSHSNPGTPGVIVEGGELGYALSTAYGAALDNPDLIVAALIGDGEAETGPTATAWHLSKFIDPAKNGAVLPILHVNGYKISGPTVFGRMTDKELKSLFYGYGYEPVVVSGSGDAIHNKMQEALEQAHKRIRGIQKLARDGAMTEPPRFPMIVLRTPKGWTGVKELKGEKIEGNCLSHQVVGTSCKTDEVELRAVEKWLKSYKFHELFDPQTGFDKDVLSCVPAQEYRMGDEPRARGETVKSLDLPDVQKFAEEMKSPGEMGSSSMRRAGAYLEEIMRRSEKDRNFRFFSPDETYSNKLDDMFKATKRGFVWPREAWDKDLAEDGRVIEMLSEHSMQGLLQGYVLTGRHGVFASYESFIPIVGSMVDQYSKFMKHMRTVGWRKPVPSLNFFLTSSAWRQEHNGFSHQNPGFIDTILHRYGGLANVYFPADATTTLVVLRHMLESRNEINVLVGAKTLEARWRTVQEAENDLENGVATWEFASDDDPHVVVSAAGDYLVKEALAAIDIVKSAFPKMRLRFVNILELSALGIGDSARGLTEAEFDHYFTPDKPVVINFHGYPGTLKQSLFDIDENTRRFTVRGYVENGSITTPYDMQVRNGTSRWQLAQEIVRRGAEVDALGRAESVAFVAQYDKKLKEHREYIIKHGVDPKEIEEWQWRR